MFYQMFKRKDGVTAFLNNVPKNLQNLCFGASLSLTDNYLWRADFTVLRPWFLFSRSVSRAASPYSSSCVSPRSPRSPMVSLPSFQLFQIWWTTFQMSWTWIWRSVKLIFTSLRLRIKGYAPTNLSKRCFSLKDLLMVANMNFKLIILTGNF